MEERRQGLRDGVRAVAPIAVGSFLFGASFGVLAAAAGTGVTAAVFMSLTTFAGSAQFAATSILDDGGGALAAVVAAVLLNARYIPISVSVAAMFPGSAAGGSRSRSSSSTSRGLSRATAGASITGGSWAPVSCSTHAGTSARSSA